MTENINPNATAALRRVIEEIRYLVDHPRIQQRTWVASGKTWLPVLEIVYGELSLGYKPETTEVAQLPQRNNFDSILVEVNISVKQTFMNIDLADVLQVEVHRSKANSFTLKDGRKYLTNPTDAQRIIDALRKAQEQSE